MSLILCPKTVLEPDLPRPINGPRCLDSRPWPPPTYQIKESNYKRAYFPYFNL
jgi:hypothetical protein